MDAPAAPRHPTSPQDLQAAVQPRNWSGLVLLCLVPLLAWAAVSVNLSDHFAQSGSPDAARQALNWHSRHPRALVELGLLQAQGERAAAMKGLREAALAQPADGRPYAALARQAQSANAPELAAKAMQQAVALSPQRTDVRLAAWEFWLEKGDPVRALESANVILNRDPDLGEQMFPQFMQLMADPRSDEAFAALLKTQVRWWPAFFDHVSRKAQKVDVLRVLYSMQMDGPNRVDEAQLRSYLSRLQRDGRWLDAYLVWLDSLPREALAFDSELYDGGFEEPSRNLGFDWLDDPVDGVLVGFDPTYGTTGARALHVVFQGLKAQWQHFHQYLMLPPGEYSLRGRTRVDSLQAERGVQWRIGCIGAAEPLASTERFKGSDEWRHFVVGFTVPAGGCDVQDLRLELVGKATLDFVANGQIWFDDLAIARK